MARRPALSKGELEVAGILWDLKQATVREVHEATATHRKMDFATVQTYLRRLAKKGYVKVTRDGRSLVYAPKVRPKTVIRETVDDLVERLFGGETMPLMQHLIEERGITEDDLAKLRKLLARLEKEQA